MQLPIDLDDPFTLAVIFVLGALGAVPLIYLGHVLRRTSPLMGAQSWNDAVRALSSELGLEHQSIPTAYDMARGSVARQSITIGYGSVETFTGVGMELRVFTTNLPDALAIRAVGAPWHRKPDELGARQRLGDASFDARVEIYGAPERLFVILRDDAELRALVVRVVVDVGATLVERDLGLLRPRFASSVDELRACLVPMIELGQYLEHPRPLGLPRGVGTPLAIALRRTEPLKDDRKTRALVEALTPLAQKLGVASMEPAVHEVGLKMRGEIDGRAVQVEIHWSLSVKITVAAEGLPDGLRLYSDRTPFDTADAEPPKPEDDPSLPIYVGEMVYVEGRRAKREAMRAAFDALPSELREALVAELPRHQIRYFRLNDDQVWLMFWPDIDEMLDPEADLSAAVALAVKAAALAGKTA